MPSLSHIWQHIPNLDIRNFVKRACTCIYILQVGFPARWSQSIGTMTDKQYVVFGYGSLIFKVILLSIYEITRFTWFLRKASTSYYRAGWEPDLSTLKTHTWYYMDWSAWIPERLRTTICSKIAWSSWDTRGESTPNAYIYNIYPGIEPRTSGHVDT